MPRLSLRFLIAPFALALLIGGVAFTAQPGAAASWPAPTMLSSPVDVVQDPEIAVGADGTAVAVWAVPISGPNPQDRPVQASVRTSSGAWSPAVSLSAFTQAFRPAVAVAPDGSALAVWEQSDGVTSRVVARTMSTTGVWGAPELLSPAGVHAGLPAVAIDQDGTATTAWLADDAGNKVRVTAGIRPKNGTWATSALVTGLTDAGPPVVAVGPGGSAAVTWPALSNFQQSVQVSVHPAGGSWTAAHTFAALASVGQPDVAAGPGGTFAVAWTAATNPGTQLFLSTATAGGAWSPATLLAAGGSSLTTVDVAMAADARPTVLWRNTVTNDVVEAVTLTPQGPSATNVSSPGSHNSQSLAVAPDGSLVAVWINNGQSSVVTARKPLSGSWSTTETVFSGPGGVGPSGAESAVGGDGTMAVLWHYGTNPMSTAQIRAVAVDALYPLITKKIKAKTKKGKTKYLLRSQSPGATFECRVDLTQKKYLVSKKQAKLPTTWKACTTPYTLKTKKLKAGKHKLYVRAVLGNSVDLTPSVKKFKVTR